MDHCLECDREDVCSKCTTVDLFTLGDDGKCSCKTGRNSQYDVSNKGYDLSQPTIIATDNRIAPSGKTKVSDRKVYGDESRSTQQANILPFALDGMLDDLADLYTKNNTTFDIDDKMSYYGEIVSEYIGKKINF